MNDPRYRAGKPADPHAPPSRTVSAFARRADEGPQPGSRRESLFRVTRGVAGVALRPFFHLRVEGRRHLPSRDAFLLLAKHQRWEDIPLLGLSAPKGLYYVAKHELFRQPLAGWFLRSLGGVPLNRSRPLESRRYLKGLIGLLRCGEGVVVFPEGTYFPQRMGPGQTGIVRLVLGRLEVPLVPAGVQYRSKGVRTSVTVRFGPPIRPPFPKMETLMQGLMRDIALLSGIEPPDPAEPTIQFRRNRERDEQQP